MKEREGVGIARRAARIAALSVALGALASSCTCAPSGGPSQSSAGASASATAGATPSPTTPASGAPSAEPSASADAAPGKFVRQRPEERSGADACAYLGFAGFACIDALLEEKDPVVRRYMRRMSDADARVAKDLYARGESPGIAHAELSMLCADSGKCGLKDENGSQLDDGYACLTKAQRSAFLGDTLDVEPAHKRACKCDATRAQIPVMGGYLACDGPNKPVERGGSLTVSEAKNIRACAECDAETGPAACAREIATLTPVDAELARYIESVHVPRCQKP